MLYQRDVMQSNMTIGSYISRMATNYSFATRHTKEMLVIDETVHVAVRLLLLEVSSITHNQTILKVQFSKSFFRKNMAILPIFDNEKKSVW